jgi:hypothetical protein
MKMTAFWDVAPCSLVEVDRRFVLMMETVCTSETSVYFYETTRLNIPESCHLQELSYSSNMKPEDGCLLGCSAV